MMLATEDAGALDLIEALPLDELMAQAAALRDAAHGRNVSYSRKVFIPLTKLCRDVCHYCTFAVRPRAGKSAYLSPDEVLAIARAGAAAGCTEALFTLGDKPEARYSAAREALEALGYGSTIEYLTAMSALVLKETGLLPHVNPGVMTRAEIAALREVSASQGIMLESVSARLCEKGGVHYGSPDKVPAVRLETIRLAGELKVPFTTGILIGIGETRRERLESLMAIRDLHRQYGHIQEVIVQNFRAKPNTKAAAAAEPDLDDLLWTVAAARLILGAAMNIQAPPNLTPLGYERILAAGINDWGGVSPVTPDHVNPEAPWPEIEALALRTASMGKILVQRLPVYPAYALDAATWLAKGIASRVRQNSDAEGFARDDARPPGRSCGMLLYGTSIIPTSVTTAAPSAPSPRARRMRICGASHMILISGKSSAARRRRGSGGRPRCACREGFTPTIPARPISRFAGRFVRRCQGCTSMPSRRSR